MVADDVQDSKLDSSSVDGNSAKMEIHAIKPLPAEPMEFRRIRVKGVESVDLSRLLQDDHKVAFARAISA
jgi:2,5-furandicarboxylate decarboxylase 1